MTPDKDKAIAMLTLRAQAAELALYQLADRARELSASIDEVVRKVHAVNKQYPLGDDTTEGMKRIVVNAIRASVPEALKLDDATIEAKFLQGATFK